MGSYIDEERTEWCCKEFESNPKKPIYDGDIYIGDEPTFIFDFKKIEFQKVIYSMMFGNGRFGNRFYGNKLNKCPFCGCNFNKVHFIQQC